MSETINGEELAGYKKKSFALPYNGGEIWFEHLDGLYGFEELVLKSSPMTRAFSRVRHRPRSRVLFLMKPK